MTSQPASAPTDAPQRPAPAPNSPAGNGAPAEALVGPAPNGSPSRGPSRPSRARGWTTRTKLLAALGGVAALLVLGAGVVYAAVAHPFRSARTDLVTHKVQFGRLE